jgi:hypothetical protein
VGGRRVEFKTFSYRSGFIGLAVAAALAAGSAALLRLIAYRGELSLQQPFSPLALGGGAAIALSLLVLALVIYWSLAVLRLSYRLDRNGLVIRWGACKWLVPMERIQAVTLGSEISAGREEEGFGWRAFRGIGWAGLRAGRARLSDGKQARIFTTGPVDQSAVVLTPGYAYVVSPRDPLAFVEAWRVRQPLGPTQHWSEAEERAPLLDLPIWRDWLAWIVIGLGLLANLCLHVYLTLVFDQLPPMLSFHFDILGQVDRIASRVALLRFPQVAFLMLVFDFGLGFVVYRWQRLAAFLLWAGGLVLQLLVWGAVLTVIG